MAPEQAEGRRDEIGPHTDVFALGAVLYQLLTGAVPFAGASTVAILDKVRFHDPPPPSRANPGLSPDVDAVCLRCLEKTPGRRYRTAADLADDLARLLGDEAGPVELAPPPAVRPAPDLGDTITQVKGDGTSVCTDPDANPHRGE